MTADATPVGPGVWRRSSNRHHSALAPVACPFVVVIEQDAYAVIELAGAEGPASARSAGCRARIASARRASEGE